MKPYYLKSLHLSQYAPVYRTPKFEIVWILWLFEIGHFGARKCIFFLSSFFLRDLVPPTFRPLLIELASPNLAWSFLIRFLVSVFKDFSNFQFSNVFSTFRNPGLRRLRTFIQLLWRWKKHNYPNQKAWRLGESAPPTECASKALISIFEAPPPVYILPIDAKEGRVGPHMPIARGPSTSHAIS